MLDDFVNVMVQTGNLFIQLNLARWNSHFSHKIDSHITWNEMVWMDKPLVLLDSEQDYLILTTSQSQMTVVLKFSLSLWRPGRRANCSCTTLVPNEEPNEVNESMPIYAVISSQTRCNNCPLKACADTRNYRKQQRFRAVSIWYQTTVLSVAEARIRTRESIQDSCVPMHLSSFQRIYPQILLLQSIKHPWWVYRLTHQLKAAQISVHSNPQSVHSQSQRTKLKLNRIWHTESAQNHQI